MLNVNANNPRLTTSPDSLLLFTMMTSPITGTFIQLHGLSTPDHPAATSISNASVLPFIVAAEADRCFQHQQCSTVFSIAQTCFGTWCPGEANSYSEQQLQNDHGCLCLNHTITPDTAPWYHCAACIKTLDETLSLDKTDYMPLYRASHARSLFCLWAHPQKALQHLRGNFTLAAETWGTFAFQYAQVNNSASRAGSGAPMSMKIASSSGAHKPTSMSKPSTSNRRVFSTPSESTSTAVQTGPAVATSRSSVASTVAPSDQQRAWFRNDGARRAGGRGIWKGTFMALLSSIAVMGLRIAGDC